MDFSLMGYRYSFGIQGQSLLESSGPVWSFIY